MRFEFRQFATDEVLSSVQLGKKVFAALVAEIHSMDSPTRVFLDFEGIEVATTSFLREAVVTFRAYARQHLANVYPIPANLAVRVKEELALFLRDRGDAMAICDLPVSGEKPSGAEVIGQLDGKSLATLKVAIGAGETDAASLATQFSDEGIGITAWNNRLAALALKGLLVEISQGRSKRYRPVLEDLTYGR